MWRLQISYVCRYVFFSGYIYICTSIYMYVDTFSRGREVKRMVLASILTLTFIYNLFDKS